ADIGPALPVDDPRQRRPDISFAEQQLGWKPKVALSEGLACTAGYFEALLDRRQPRTSRSGHLSSGGALAL
ncbi:hypothetical protein EOA23_18305, partial [Mesorhizobium sp. M2A.F.Ca.ET.042.01.1.1]